MRRLGKIAYVVLVMLAWFMVALAGMTVGAMVAGIPDARIGQIIAALMVAGVFWLLGWLIRRMTN